MGALGSFQKRLSANVPRSLGIYGIRIELVKVSKVITASLDPSVIDAFTYVGILDNPAFSAMIIREACIAQLFLLVCSRQEH